MARILTEESSLTRRRKALDQETRALQRLLRFEAGAAIVLSVMGGVAYVWKGDVRLLGVGIAVTVFYLAHRLRVVQNAREAKIVQAGLRGESEVTKQLAESLDNSHYLFNDLLVKVGRRSAQIDHLVVSPNGMFAIETKNWRGHIEGREEDERWTQTKGADGPPIRVANPIQQTKRHVEIMREAFERAGIEWTDIHSMVVFLSPKTSFDVPSSSVPVLRPKEAVRYIQACQPDRPHNESELDKVVHLLMSAA